MGDLALLVFFFFMFIYLNVCLLVCLYTMYVLAPLGLKLKAVVSCHADPGN